MASIIKSNQFKAEPIGEKSKLHVWIPPRSKINHPHPLNKFIIVVSENISSVVLCTEMYDRT